MADLKQLCDDILKGKIIERGADGFDKEREEEKKAKREEIRKKKVKGVDESTGTPMSLQTGQSMSNLPATQLSRQSIPGLSTKISPWSTSDIAGPLIVGLYGISGSGKTYLLEQLSQTSLSQHFDFVDGSTLIDNLFGLAEFRTWKPEVQNEKRAELMSQLKEERRSMDKGLVVGGHLLLWSDEAREPRNVASEADWKAYTHIVYLQVDPGVVQKRRKYDKIRNRSAASVEHLARWQARERAELRSTCYTKRILFTTVTEVASSPDGEVLEHLQTLLRDFQRGNEKTNLEAIDTALATAMSSNNNNLETMLVLDADKTLAPQDTGSMFWRFIDGRKGMPGNPLYTIFKSQGYSYDSFRQAALLHEELANDFDHICMQIAARVELYPEMAVLLARVAAEPHAGAVIVTCGLRRVWEMVLRISGLTHVKVIGAGRLSDGYVVTDTNKEQIVQALKGQNLRVVAFGDSPLDVTMLEEADEAYVIVGEQEARSKSMDSKLSRMIDRGFRCRQVLLPSTTEPRLNTQRLPVVELGEAELNNIFRQRFVHATHKAFAKLLMTATRNNDVIGHDLRKAHEEVGYYLANEFLGEIIGIESYSMKHVTGGTTDGYRFRDEKKTLIIPLMRGGEPMAFGVSKALKLASFVHSYVFSDIKPANFEGKETIILVDSVVNTGKSILEYLQPLRALYPRLKVVVVAGVVQAKAVENVKKHTFGHTLRKDPNITLVALRKSDNKYTGKGVTDTGHRLFNTTYLD